MTIRTGQIRRSTFVVAAMLVIGTLAVADGLTPETMVDLRQVRQVAVAPDGERVAYTLRVQRDEADDPGGPYSELWVVGKDGESRHFAGDSESISNVSWSHSCRGRGGIAGVRSRGVDPASRLVT
jgi:hypothetical protein